MNAKFKKFTWFILFWTFLVIAAGGIVRMTQSGMGCPDWPTCFGRWIPPINESQLPHDFENYLSKQDIDHTFNVYHTWIEYINRLLGFMLGNLCLIHFGWSLINFRKNKNWSLLLYSFLMLIGVAFQAWLGKRVVDANLASNHITYHMVGALVLSVFPLLIVNYHKPKVSVPKLIPFSIVITIVLLLIQIILGTQVRGAIDVISKSLSYSQRELWISSLGAEFITHRSFSWLLLLSSVFLCYSSSKHPTVSKHGYFQLLILILIIVLGIIMAYLNIPAIAQPLHLILASLLFCYLVHYLLRIKF